MAIDTGSDSEAGAAFKAWVEGHDDILSDWYEQARSRWDKNEYTDILPNEFVWDVQEARFNWNPYQNINAVAVHPEVYVDAIAGRGYMIDTPLNKQRDRREAAELLGEEFIEENSRGSFFKYLEKPAEVPKMHEELERRKKDIFIPENYKEYILTAAMSDDLIDIQELSEVLDDVINLINFKLQDNSRTETLPEEVVSESDQSLVSAAKELERNTAIVTYSPDLVYTINEMNEGSLAYYSPALLNMRLRKDYLSRGSY